MRCVSEDLLLSVTTLDLKLQLNAKKIRLIRNNQVGGTCLLATILSAALQDFQQRHQDVSAVKAA